MFFCCADVKFIMIYLFCRRSTCPDIDGSDTVYVQNTVEILTELVDEYPRDDETIDDEQDSLGDSLNHLSVSRPSPIPPNCNIPTVNKFTFSKIPAINRMRSKTDVNAKSFRRPRLLNLKFKSSKSGGGGKQAPNEVFLVRGRKGVAI